VTNEKRASIEVYDAEGPNNYKFKDEVSSSEDSEGPLAKGSESTTVADGDTSDVADTTRALSKAAPVPLMIEEKRDPALKDTCDAPSGPSNQTAGQASDFSCDAWSAPGPAARRTKDKRKEVRSPSPALYDAGTPILMGERDARSRNLPALDGAGRSARTRAPSDAGMNKEKQGAGGADEKPDGMELRDAVGRRGRSSRISSTPKCCPPEVTTKQERVPNVFADISDLTRSPAPSDFPAGRGRPRRGRPPRPTRMTGPWGSRYPQTRRPMGPTRPGPPVVQYVN